MRKKFEHMEDADSLDKIKEFKERLSKYLPNLKTQIEETSPEKIKAMIPFVIDRIQIYGEVAEFNYLFELPDYKSEKSLKSLNKVKAGSDQNKKILYDLYQRFDKITEKEFETNNISKICGEYLYENKGVLKNEDVYHLLRYILSGIHSGGPVGKIMEILGKEEVLKRIRPWL